METNSLFVRGAGRNRRMGGNPMLRVASCDMATCMYLVVDELDPTQRVYFSRPGSADRKAMLLLPDAMRSLMLPVGLATVGHHGINYELKVVDGQYAAFRENDRVWWARVHDYELQAYDDKWLEHALFTVFAYEGLYTPDFAIWTVNMKAR